MFVAWSLALPMISYGMFPLLPLIIFVFKFKFNLLKNSNWVPNDWRECWNILKVLNVLSDPRFILYYGEINLHMQCSHTISRVTRRHKYEFLKCIILQNSLKNQNVNDIFPQNSPNHLMATLYVQVYIVKLVAKQ